MPTTTEYGFFVSFAINTAIALGTVVSFLILRRIPYLSPFYLTRDFNYIPNSLNNDTHPTLPAHKRTRYHLSPISFFKGLTNALLTPDDIIFATQGLDTLMYLKFLRLCLILVIILLAFGVIILMPINATGERAGTSLASGLASISIASIERKSERLWAHLISVIFNTFIICYFLTQYFRKYVLYRQEYKSLPSPHNHTAMVRGMLMSTSEENTITNEFLKKEFETIFPGNIVEVNRHIINPAISRKVSQRFEAVKRLERAEAILAKTGKTPKQYVGYFPPRKFDAIDYWRGAIDKLEQDIRNFRNSQDSYPSNVAFVTFDSVTTASAFSQLIISMNPNKYLVGPAQDVKDVEWTSLNVSRDSQYIRRLVVNVMTFFLVFFWAIPVAFISGLSNLSTLSKVKELHFLVQVLEWNSFVRGFVEGFLPSLALIIFMQILLPILQKFVDNEGYYWKSHASRSLMSKFFAFLLFNVLLVYTISGSIFGVLEQIIDHPQNIIKLLSTTLPKQSGFFVNYIMLASLGKHTLFLLRPGALFIFILKRKFFAKSKRDYKELTKPQPFPYVEQYSYHLLVLITVIMFSTLSPFILPFGLLYFVLAILSSYYNAIYVFKTDYEGGGIIFPSLVNRIFVGLILYQLTMIGVFSSLEFFPGGALFVLVLITVLLWYWLHKSYHKLSKFGSILELAAKYQESERMHIRELKGVYLQPELKYPPEHEIEEQDEIFSETHISEEDSINSQLLLKK